MIAVPGSVLLAPLLWLAGTVLFDAVHAVLHAMLRSRFRALRALARPHAIHHAWLDGRLRTHWEHRRGNVVGHLCLEYATQLAMTGALAFVLPAAPLLGCARATRPLHPAAAGGVRTRDPFRAPRAAAA